MSYFFESSDSHVFYGTCHLCLHDDYNGMLESGSPVSLSECYVNLTDFLSNVTSRGATVAG